MTDFNMSLIAIGLVCLFCILVGICDARRPKHRHFFTLYCGINMRKQPTAESEKIADIPQYSHLVALKQSGHWVKVKYKNLSGITVKGWVLATAMYPTP